MKRRLLITTVALLAALLLGAGLAGAYFTSSVDNPQRLTTDQPSNWAHLTPGASSTVASGADGTLAVNLNATGGGCQSGTGAFTLTAVNNLPQFNAVGAAMSVTDATGTLGAQFEGTTLPRAAELKAGDSETVDLTQSGAAPAGSTATVIVSLLFPDLSTLHYAVPVTLCSG